VIVNQIASEGLSKKVSVQGQELTEARASLRTVQEERMYLRSRVLELEKGLSSGRSLRLKEMHENELFKRKITDLESRMLTAEEENRAAQSRCAKRRNGGTRS
jgi:hypothetical protein